MRHRLPIAAGNWKMHHGPRATAEFFRAFLDAVPPRERDIIIFPPAASIAAAAAEVRDRGDVTIGSQNVYWEAKGAFTGEISTAIAREAGAEIALVGHSERRHVFGETDEDTARKLAACLRDDLAPMLCVGEMLDERDAGAAAAVVRRQLSVALDGLAATDAARILIAYEPVWAIGTGRTASPEDAAEMHGEIRLFLSERFDHGVAEGIPILYGGSVKPANAAELLAAPNVDGVLVGGASLDPSDFARICDAPG